MTKNEAELIKMIHENDNHEQALMLAVAIILADLKQHESSAEPFPVALPVPC